MHHLSAKRAARMIRFLSDPPFTGGLFVLILSAVRRDLFKGADLWLLLLFLGVLPVFGYLIRPQSRNTRQRLPFLATFVSYAAGCLWTSLAGCNAELVLICQTYFFSATLLTVLNLFAHSNASGHVCGMVGPTVLLMYLTSLQFVWIGSLLLLIVIIWASVYLGIHHLSDFFQSALVFGTAFLIALAFGGWLGSI